MSKLSTTMSCAGDFEAQNRRHLVPAHNNDIAGTMPVERESNVQTKVIDGKTFSEKLLQRVAIEAKSIEATIGRTPALAVILIGENPASAVYVRNKIERTTTAGMRSIEHRFPATIDQTTVLSLIAEMNLDESVDGILVQLPLPKQIDENAVINAISPETDVDGFHVVNSGLLATGQDSLVPCTPYGCLLLLREQLGSLSGLNAVVVGRSNIVENQWHNCCFVRAPR